MGRPAPRPTLHSVAATPHRHVWLWVAATVAAMAGTVLALAAMTGAPSRSAVVAMLQRPAAPAAAAVTPAPGGHARVTAGGMTYTVRLVPNRASVRNRLEITSARPLAKATITVAFSMPAMGMWHAFSLVLHPIGPGRFAAVMPYVGMAGAWRLDARVAGAQTRVSAFAISDTLGS